MIEWFSQFGFGELWIMLGVFLLIVELLIPSFFIGSFGISAFVAAATAGFGASLPWQIVVFGVLGTALVFPARKFFLKQSPELKMSVDSLEGQQGLCVEAIDGVEAGTVQLAGSRWTATTAAGTLIAIGQHVQIVQRNGVKLVVAPVP